ncbi:clathrin heavy chain linker domain-containing protein 1-like isoform X2 [Denticeps clupeoides]|uniref:clathrin heavy chain linker domain-containing protein 1-like isoform X2 n=1 Tax=Denticeps clupeoides TaxID=299321 RepID=UPI0010A3E86D|nr:clathrin heavy chain linker domain-containing protein 1 isoform X2 [Denticeps clupeoides]
MSDIDIEVLNTVCEYIKRETARLSGREEQRFTIYTSAFDMLSQHSFAYKSVLTAIKKEYDEFISALRRKRDDAACVYRKMKAIQASCTLNYDLRAAQLQDRIAVIRRDTAEMQSELKRHRQGDHERGCAQRQKTCPFRHIPGLTFDESMDPDALIRYMKCLEKARDNLLSRKQRMYRPGQVQAELDGKMVVALDHRDSLMLENDRLQLRYTRLKFVNDAVYSWERAGSNIPLMEFLSKELENITALQVCEADYNHFSGGASEDDDPGKANESKLIDNYIKRLTDLFEGGEYEAAAFHAAKSPHGVLRNMETVERFKAVAVDEDGVPPLLLFFKALTTCAHAGKPLLAEDLSVEAAQCALQHSLVDLVTHWIYQHRLTLSEALGDVIFLHQDRNVHVKDTCLVLAQLVYAGCGSLQKAVLCMCKRGLFCGSVEFIQQHEAITLDDCMWVIRTCPDVDLLQAWTQSHEGRPALLSVGYVSHALLNHDLEDVALLLLKRIQLSGEGRLQKAVLEDEGCSVEDWGQIATCCRKKGQQNLAEEVMSALSQGGAICLSPGTEGLRLMEHVFM